MKSEGLIREWLKDKTADSKVELEKIVNYVMSVYPNIKIETYKATTQDVKESANMEFLSIDYRTAYNFINGNIDEYYLGIHQYEGRKPFPIE